MAVTQEKAFETPREIILSPDERTAAFIAKMKNRTPEEIEQVRALSMGGHTPRPLPPGKTLEDVIVGALPDDEDDTVIIALIEDMD